MSILHLQDPDKVHELVDDLESVYWACLYGSIKLFAGRGGYYPMNIFNDRWPGVGAGAPGARGRPREREAAEAGRGAERDSSHTVVGAR